MSIQDYDSEEKFTIREDHISHLLPTSYQDMIVRVYSKKPELVCQIKYYHSFDHCFCLHLSCFGLNIFIFFNANVQVGAISEAFENFQLKTYGVKAQVHATPEKKKRRILL